MVEFIKMRPKTVSFIGAGNDLSVKLEIAAEHDDDHGHVSKRSRLSPSTFIQWSPGNNEFPATPSQYNLLDEPSPLGLSLRKSPSLLDLIQMKLSQSNASALAAVSSENISFSSTNMQDTNGAVTSIATDKWKASNFAVSLLRIGCWDVAIIQIQLHVSNAWIILLVTWHNICWQFVSRHEDDLVAKCYFAKHKLVWEVLEGGLKSKIEIRWSDIMALKASCPDNVPCKWLSLM